MRTIVVATGGFDPVHSGHIAYLKEASLLGDALIVGINSDCWLERKKQKPFMPWAERNEVISNLKMVNLTIDFNDNDGSAIEAIKKVRYMFPNDKIVFVNGGDRNQENIPEMTISDNNLEFVFAVGGEYKKNSSSWILKKWKED